MPSLLDMTDVPMVNILEQCDFKSVLKLRKVCHDLRNFIDDANFKTDLKKVDIEFRRVLSHSSKGNVGRCPISLTFKSLKIHNCEHMTPDDLRILLNLQNSKLSSFKISNKEETEYMRFVRVCLPETFFKNHGTLDDLEEYLRNKPRPLQTETVDIGVSRGSQVMQILPYLDSKTVKNIRISNTDFEVKKLDEIEKILELDQFKNATELRIDGLTVNGDLKKFFRFERISVKFQEIRMEDLVALKKVFTTSPHMKEFRLHGYKMDNAQFEREFGPPSTDNTISKKWYFKIRSSKDEVLEIYYASNGISFRRIKAAYVEGNVVVRD